MYIHILFKQRYNRENHTQRITEPSTGIIMVSRILSAFNGIRDRPFSSGRAHGNKNAIIIRLSKSQNCLSRKKRTNNKQIILIIFALTGNTKKRCIEQFVFDTSPWCLLHAFLINLF